MKTVITYGTFDLLHIGHINLLQRARALGDKLIVALSTDEFNATMKDKHCIQPYEERKIILESLMFVDMVIPEENWEQKIADVQKYDANVFVIGKDWEGKFDFLKEHCEVVYLERTEGISTTDRKIEISKRVEKSISTMKQTAKQCAICFFITKDYVFTVANTIIGLMRYSKDAVEIIYIFHDGIPDNTKNQIETLFSNIVFCEISKEKVTQRLGKEVFESQEVQRFVSNYSMLMFGKFDAIDLLSKHERILVLDTDILIQNDISGIVKHGPLAARPILKPLCSRLTSKSILEIDSNYYCPNIGVLYLSKEIKQLSSQLCYKYFKNYYKDFSTNALDESIFGFILYSEKIEFTILDAIWNCWPTHQFAKQAIILHSVGKNKFWNSQEIFYEFNEWMTNNKIWCSITGGDVTDNLKTIKPFTNQLIPAINTRYWKDILASLKDEYPIYLTAGTDFSKAYYQLFIRKLSRRVHYELAKTAQGIQISLHCEDTTLRANAEWKHMFEICFLELKPFNFENNSSEQRFSIVKQTNSKNLLNDFSMLVSKTLQRLYNVSNVTIDDFETFGVPTSTVKTNAQNLEHCLRYDAQMTTASYISRNAYKCKKFQTKYELLSYALQHIAMDGIIAEFGVAKGNTLKHIIKIISDKDIYGFDSFEGLPEDWRTGFMQGAFSVDTVAEFPEHVHLQKGYFEDTLPDFVLANHENCAFLHIDCDLYSSTKTIFKYLGHRIVQGAIIVFDEYFNYPSWQEHEFKAFKEYIEYSKHTYEYLGYVNNNEQVCIRITS